MIKKLSLPLFWKFTIAITLVVAIFGSLNLYFINFALSDLSNKEINRYGSTLAKIIAERSVDPILYDDISSLDQIVSDNIKIDPSIAFIIILDKFNNIITHTFKQNVPVDLLNLKKTKNNTPIRIVDTKNPDNPVRVISVPILEGNLGEVRIGVYENMLSNSLQAINSFFISMIMLFLFIGILGAFFFSYIITSPIKQISKIAESLNIDSLKVMNESSKNNYIDSLISNLNNAIKINDEIDVLSDTFNQMLIRLQKTYQELQKTQESLMQSEKTAAIGTLSAGIAHEINNPIAGIQNCLNRISKNPDNISQNIKYIDLMQEAIQKIKTVVQGLLNFSRKYELILTPVDITKVIENTLLLIAYQLEKSRITIIKNYPDKIPLISGSFNHLEQVFLNFIIHAIDALEEEKLNNENTNGEIEITIKPLTHFLRIEIKDNGIGINPDKLTQIFDPFFTSKKIKQGTGLGLAVSLNIIKEHLGTLQVKQPKEKGLIFIIELPLIK